MASDTRPCPFCAEDIKVAAIVCKHCKRDLPVRNASAMGAAPKPNSGGSNRLFAKFIFFLLVGVLVFSSLFGKSGTTSQPAKNEKGANPAESTPSVTSASTPSADIIAAASPAERARCESWTTDLDEQASCITKAKRTEEKRIAEERQAEEKRVSAEREASDKRLAAEKAAEAKVREEAACRTDLQCWAGKHKIDAKYACTPRVEQLAKIDAQWSDTGWFDSRFSQIRWENQDRGILTYIGDRVKFQNGFGAWIPYTYQCTYDTLKKAMASVRVSEGRLPPR